MSKRTKIALGVVGAIVLISIIGALTSHKSKTNASPAATSSAAPAISAAVATATAAVGPSGVFQHPEDVKVSSCGADDLGLLTAQVVVTNTSRKPSSYSITLNFESTDGQTQYGEGFAVITSLAPDQHSPQKVTGTAQAPSGVTIVCRVTSAQRTAALG